MGKRRIRNNLDIQISSLSTANGNLSIVSILIWIPRYEEELSADKMFSRGGQE